MSKRRVVLAVHGGAGVILRSALTPEMEEEYRSALRDALSAGYAVLTRRSNEEEEDDDRNGGCQEKDVATDAVEAAVRCMEDCPLFNAGKGSVFTHDGRIRCDASIMACSSFDNNKAACIDNSAAAPSCDKAKDDTNINTDNNNEGIITTPHQIIQKRRYPKTPHPKAGAVAGVRNIQNPISLAKAVMHRTPHVMLLGQGAEDFARQLSQDARVQIQSDDYFWTERRWKQLVSVRNAEQREEEKQNKQQVRKVQLDHSIPQEEVVESSDVDDNDEQREKKFGTVGCIALYRRPDYDSSNENSYYQLASATSTGGMTNVRHHRVGDSPIIGAGTYANHLCAISCTGHGEWFIRCVAAHDIAKRLEYKYGYDGTTSCDATTDNTLLKKALDEVIFGTLMSESDCGEQGGDGGAIALDKDGNFAADMNCPGMYHGWVYEDGEMETRIFWNE